MFNRRPLAKVAPVGDGGAEVLWNAAEVAGPEVPKEQVLVDLALGKHRQVFVELGRPKCGICSEEVAAINVRACFHRFRSICSEAGVAECTGRARFECFVAAFPR